MNRSSSHRRRDSLIRRAFALRTDGVSRRVVSGAGFQFLGIALRTALTIGSTAILARLLSPSDFGYVAMATVVTEFAALFGSFGFTNVLIQRKVINRLQLDTVFWATLGVGCALAVVVVTLSFASHLLFADPQVGPLLRALSINFVFGSLTAVSWVVLSRQLRFRTQFWIQILAVAIRITAAVGFAYSGLGVWSLVLGGIVGSLSSAVLSFIHVPYLPRWRFHLPLLTATWRTSSSYFGSTALYYINNNLDLLLIGRQLGATPLGFYQNARSFTDEIRARIAMPLQHVLFPAFSAMQADRERFQKLVLRAGRMLAAIVIPIGVGVSANAPELVAVLYGERWLPMVPVMVMFGLSGALKAATAISSPLFNSNNRVGLALRYNAIGTTLMVTSVLFSMPYGLTAVATAIAVTSLYSFVVFRAALGLIGIGARGMIDILMAPIASAAVMWFAIAGLQVLNWTPHVSLKLALQVGVGATVYLLVLHLMSRTYWLDFRDAAAMLLRKG